MEILNILFIILLVLTFSKRENGNPFSLQSMNVLKGIAIAGVFIGHASKEFLGVFLYKFLCYIGLWSVAIFFFVSGYGLMYMASRKPDYRKGYLKKRFLPILICYLIVCMIQMAIDGEFESGVIQRILLCDYIPFSWYIFSIIWLYLFFYITLIFISPLQHKKLFICCLLGLLIVYMLVCQRMTGGTKGGEQMLSFIVGCLVASSETIRLKCLQRKSLIIATTIFLILYLIQLTNKYVHYPYALVYVYEPIVSCIFTFIALGIVARRHSYPPKLEKMWGFLQRHSLQIYLIHGILLYNMIERLKLPSELLVCLILFATIGAAFVLRTILSFLMKKI